MNGIITLCVVVSFCVAFTALFLVTTSENITPSKKIQNFYSQDFDSNSKKVLLLGSSYVGTLNTTLINEKISVLDKNYDLYNLAITSDHPQKRIKQIEKIVSIKPDLVVYGISYFAFQSEIEKDPAPLPAIDNLKSVVGFESEPDPEPYNPKFVTLQSLRGFLVDLGIWTGSDSRYSLPNTPFFSFGSNGSKISNDEEIRTHIMENADAIKRVNIEYDSNIRASALKEMLKILDENEIHVLLFIPPLHEGYHDLVPAHSKNSFKLILGEIANEHDIEIFDLSHKYKDLNVWRDISHISYNKKSMIYSNDVANIIISHIKS